MRYLILILTFTSVSIFGQTWENIFKPTQNKYYKVLNSGGETYLLTNESYKLVIYRTTDDGSSWQKIQENKKSGTIDHYSVTADITGNGNIFIPIGISGNITRLGFNPNSFLETFVETENSITTIKMKSDEHGVAGNKEELFITNNSWFQSKKITVNGLTSVWYNENNTISYISVDEKKETTFNFSIDNGESWNSSFVANFNAEKLYFINNNIGFIIGSLEDMETKPWTYTNLIYRTTNAGLDWNLVFKEKNEKISVLNDISFSTNEIGIASGFSNNVYLTYDGGKNWQNHKISGIGDNEYKLTACGFSNSKFIAAVNDYGIFALNEPLLSTEIYGTISDKYAYTIFNNEISFENYTKKAYQISDIKGNILQEGITFGNLKFGDIQEKHLIINLNNEFTIKLVK
ncbi:MAG: hypothetical protein R2863_09090 [Candidatus Kapaibacterium sp.]